MLQNEKVQWETHVFGWLLGGVYGRGGGSNDDGLEGGDGKGGDMVESGGERGDGGGGGRRRFRWSGGTHGAAALRGEGGRGDGAGEAGGRV